MYKQALAVAVSSAVMFGISATAPANATPAPKKDSSAEQQMLADNGHSKDMDQRVGATRGHIDVTKMTSEERAYYEQLQIIRTHVVEGEDGFYSLDVQGAVADGADPVVAENFAKNLEDANFKMMTRSWSGMWDCLINIGGLSVSQVALIMASFAGGPAGMLVAALAMGFSVYSVVQSCCRRGYCSA